MNPVSPTGRKALLRLAANEERGTVTHVSAIHQSARMALVSRGLVDVDGPYLTLTELGREEARRAA